MNTNHLLAELEHELVSTKELIERVPAKQLNWQPHFKAMTLGQLAYHTAVIPFRYLTFVEEGSTTFEKLSYHHSPKDKQEIIDVFTNGSVKAKELLQKLGENETNHIWNLTKDGAVIFSLPVSMFIRMLVFNHLFHHRGQLSTYLRSLDIALPSIYGPSADFNPFA